MLLKLILVVTCLCVAQATYIVQAPDDSSYENAVSSEKVVEDKDENIEQSDEFGVGSDDASPSARVCFNSNCNSFCRSRGYAWGTCININVCRCYRYRQALPQNANPEQNEVKINQDDDSEDTSKLNAENLTHDFNFPLASEEIASVFASARACTNNVCNNLCRYLGYNWGQCISTDTCRCYRSALALEENSHPEEDIAVKINKVDKEDSIILFAEIDNAVDDFNIPIAAKANANSDASLADDDEIDNDNDGENDINESGNKSILAKVLSTAEEDAYMKAARACNADVCNRNCQALHYDKGICIINRCQCLGRSIWFRGNPVETENENNQETDALNEVNEGPALLEQNLVSESRSLSDCNNLWCVQTCRRMGFPGGVCVNGRCKCDIL